MNKKSSCRYRSPVLDNRLAPQKRGYNKKFAADQKESKKVLESQPIQLTANISDYLLDLLWFNRLSGVSPTASLSCCSSYNLRAAVVVTT